LFELALGPLALSVIGVSDKESIATIRQLEAQHGGDWIHPWLQRRNLSLEDFT
jgi:type IV secretion system protein VirB4